MSTERNRNLATLFGLFALAVQLRLLYKLVNLAFDYELGLTHFIPAEDLFTRLAWLKAPLWTPERFMQYTKAFLVLCVGGALWLWLRGAVVWWRGRGEEQP